MIGGALLRVQGTVNFGQGFRLSAAQRNGRSRIRTWVPAQGRPQEAGGELALVIEIGKERRVGFAGKHAAQKRIDHCIEDKIVDLGHASKETSVTEQHMMQFVHDEHEKLFRRFCPCGDKIRIDQQPGLNAAFDRGRLDSSAF